MIRRARPLPPLFFAHFLRRRRRVCQEKFGEARAGALVTRGRPCLAQDLSQSYPLLPTLLHSFHPSIHSVQPLLSRRPQRTTDDSTTTNDARPLIPPPALHPLPRPPVPHRPLPPPPRILITLLLQCSFPARRFDTAEYRGCGTAGEGG